MATVGHVWPEMKGGEDRMREQEGGMSAKRGLKTRKSMDGWIDGWMGIHMGERVPSEVYVIPHPITAAFFLFSPITLT